MRRRRCLASYLRWARLGALIVVDANGLSPLEQAQPMHWCRFSVVSPQFIHPAEFVSVIDRRLALGLLYVYSILRANIMNKKCSDHRPYP